MPIVTLDFEDGANFTQIGDFYLDQGVSFSSNASWYPAASLPGASGVFIIGDNEGHPFLFDSPIVVSFTGSVQSFSLDAIDVGFAGMRIEAYDADGQFLAADEVFGTTPSGVGEFETLSVSAADIRSIKIYQPAVDEFFAVDAATLDDFVIEFAVPGLSKSGGNGRDILVGDDGADTLSGSNGPDELDGLGGNDILTGGNGPDRFIIRANSGQDRITDFSGQDTVALLTGNPALDSFAEVQAAITDTADGALLDLGGGNTVLFEGVARASFASNDFVFTA
jgi:Ca2+-binding RTX toxin-like protein